MTSFLFPLQDEKSNNIKGKIHLDTCTEVTKVWIFLSTLLIQSQFWTTSSPGLLLSIDNVDIVHLSC